MVAAPPIPERALPPPVPPARVAVKPEPEHVEPIVIVAESASESSPGRSLLLMLGGVILGTAATMAIVMLSSSSSTAASYSPERAGPPSSVLVPAATPAPFTPATLSNPLTLSTPVTWSTPATFEISDERIAAPASSPMVATQGTATDGVILLPSDAAGRRLFVDGRVVPVKGSRAVVPCGDREVRIGSRGVARNVAVVCGGETELLAARMR
ncbi:MAG: hypothetical protein H0T42_27200 [Deltaproteobacteria bacterium]|nr:hypothetical protein [Deltaproteobacteria bacterium]